MVKKNNDLVEMFGIRFSKPQNFNFILNNAIFAENLCNFYGDDHFPFIFLFLHCWFW